MLEKPRRETLTAQVASTLMEHIEEQQLQPGDKLPSSAKLSELLGVSKPVVREALKSLEGRGITEVVNGKGVIVRAVDQEQLGLYFRRMVALEDTATLDLMELRKGLEGQSAALAAVRRTPEDLQRISDVLERMGACIGEFDSYSDLDVEFHVLLAEASKNRVLAHLISSVRDALRQAVRKGLEQRAGRAELEEVQRLHAAVLERVKLSDAAGARQAMDNHFDAAVTALAVGESRRGQSKGLNPMSSRGSLKRRPSSLVEVLEGGVPPGSFLPRPVGSHRSFP